MSHAAANKSLPPDAEKQIGQFLTDIEHPGLPASRALIDQYAELVISCGPGRGERYWRAVKMVKADNELRPPTVSALDAEIARRRSAHRVRIAEFLNEAGVVTDDLEAWRTVVGDAGSPGSERWQVMVAVARETPAGEIPTLEELRLAWDWVDSTREERLVRILLAGAGYEGPFTARIVDLHRPLVDVVGDPVGGPRWRAAVHVLAHWPGKQSKPPPPAEQMGALINQRLAEASVHEDRRRSEAHVVAARHASAARAYVAAVRGMVGVGPTWGELARQLDLRPANLSYYVIRELHSIGAVSSTEEYRSLDVGAGETTGLHERPRLAL